MSNTIMRIVLAGESGTGKSTSMNHILSIKNPTIYESFNPHSTISCTVGADLGFYIEYFGSNQEEVKIMIVDTAGSEKYHAIAQSYFKCATAIMIMYDITSYLSFQNIKNYWFSCIMGQIQESSIPIMLVGNKIDNETLRQVPYKTGLKYAEENGFIFLETSAKLGPSTIRNAYDTLATAAYQNMTLFKKMQFSPTTTNPKPTNNENINISSSSSTLDVLKKKQMECCV